ncbi:hypothetical protein [Lacticaseibacillus camelliae]|uniref:Uncharacterized protein n=1 Tax=Lacticaseibacillus camelliae DSM 22697 = JCM 13995 TaxID=1423730 RepID=A0A0R2F9X0_9LACO|nr:hypothetical protein [Lacticaseibacillus camelliae]KRN22263.1 hypothetical protein FC75_GL001902 [Lacticaseibacillus camelliae DSM 22697 = JCM 13995]
MEKLITVVYYQQGSTFRLIKAFSSPTRAEEYLRMIQHAPFPGEQPSGYQQTVLHLN